MAVATVDGSALAGRAGVRFLDFRNEQSAGYAAAAYDFLMGTPGQLLTVSGPGCVHALAGVSHATTTATAWLLMVSGSCDQADTGKGDFQELDQIPTTKPFAKLAVKATTIADISRLVFQALAGATCYLEGCCRQRLHVGKGRRARQQSGSGRAPEGIVAAACSSPAKKRRECPCDSS